MTQNNRILILDDDEQLCNFLSDVASENDFDVCAVQDPDAFFKSVDSYDPGLILLDLMMPRMDGVEVLRQLGVKPITADIALMSGADKKVLKTAKALAESFGLRIRAVLTKPIALHDLEAVFCNTQVNTGPIDSNELSEAIEKQQLEVFYQPKVSLITGDHFAIQGAEALVRWRHPSRGLVFPDQFIELAEQSSLIGPLTDLVLASVAQQIAIWRANGYDLTVAVNLAPQSLADTSLPDRLASIMANAGVSCDHVMLEVTERAAMGDHVDVMDSLTRLRLKGFGLSMDDFGAGYSSLVDLYRMPFMELKIDRSLICDIATEQDAQTIASAIIQMAHNLDLTVCAEGVETFKDVQVLQSMGCDRCQGFYFVKAVPATEMTEFLVSGFNAAADQTPGPAIVKTQAAAL